MSFVFHKYASTGIDTQTHTVTQICAHMRPYIHEYTCAHAPNSIWQKRMFLNYLFLLALKFKIQLYFLYCNFYILYLFVWKEKIQWPTGYLRKLCKLFNFWKLDPPHIYNVVMYIITTSCLRSKIILWTTLVVSVLQ